MNELVKIDDKSKAVSLPDYLSGNEVSGLEDLDSSDFKIPRLLLLQALSPAVTQTHQGVAIPGQFWHTGLQIDLGDKLNIVPLIARKRVILWRPQEDNGGGILAFSYDGKEWATGGNQKFTIRMKGVREPIVWDTKENVAKSGLLTWGSSNPADPESSPAAALSYEYLCYLPDTPELSPVVLSCNKTALSGAKQFNTGLLMKANAKLPSYCLNVVLSVGKRTEGQQSWFVPQFQINGTVTKEVYDMTSALYNQHKEYKSDVESEKAAVDVSGETAF